MVITALPCHCEGVRSTLKTLAYDCGNPVQYVCGRYARSAFYLLDRHALLAMTMGSKCFFLKSLTIVAPPPDGLTTDTPPPWNHPRKLCLRGARWAVGILVFHHSYTTAPTRHITWGGGHSSAAVFGHSLPCHSRLVHPTNTMCLWGGRARGMTECLLCGGCYIIWLMRHPE